ncbi:MAG: 50S ribosomal protein L23 [Bacteriovoracales bacterium]|nr:50S ribosomal protein L23 [Bacteriovoracales bacterium]
MSSLKDVIVRPLITEKVSNATDDGNVYGFYVDLRSNKNRIREAVEWLYKVKVIDVKTMINPGKLRRRKQRVLKSSKWKKALVKIESGQKIELLKGV